MVEPEKIIIGDFFFIFLLDKKINGENKILWMMSINGTGNCGRSCSESSAIQDILKSSKLTEKMKIDIEKKYQDRLSGIKNNKTIKSNLKRSVQFELF